MATETVKRLHYYQRQYLGAEDFEAQQTYHRDMRRRHNLAHHTWGIVVGLELVEMEMEKEGEDAGLDVYVQPGMAVDGFGREIIVTQRYKLEPALFNAFTKEKHYQVWIAYDEEHTHRPRAGYELCDVADQFGRVRETFRIVVEPEEPTHDSVVVDGEKMELPPSGTIPTPGELTIPRDESVPYQEFPDDDTDARWLVRLGSVHWDGTKFISAVEEERQYVRSIAAEVLAPARELLIRDRDTESSLPDGEDGVATTIEGSLQVERLLTAKQDLHVQGKVGIGTTEPEYELDVPSGWFRFGPGGDGGRISAEYGSRNAPLLRLSDYDDPPRIQFQQIGGGEETAPEFSSWIGHARNKSSDIALMEGNVGIGTETPRETLEVNGSIRGNQQGALRISTDTGWTDIGSKNEGWSHFHTDRPRYYFNKEIRVDSGKIGSYNEDLSLCTSGVARITIRNVDGRVGIGKTNPTEALHVAGDDPDLALDINSGSPNNWAELRFKMDNQIKSRIFWSKVDNKLYFENMGVRALTIDHGNIGVGTPTPAATLDVNGRILRKGQALSVVGFKGHGETVSVPWGTTDDWSIFVSPRVMGEEEPNSEADNAVLKIECYVTATSNTQWQITARYKFKYWNDNPRNGLWRNGSANYVLIPR